MAAPAATYEAEVEPVQLPSGERAFRWIVTSSRGVPMARSFRTYPTRDTAKQAYRRVAKLFATGAIAWKPADGD